jgi:hypothetical protein
MAVPVRLLSGNQPAKVYPVLVGEVGATKSSPVLVVVEVTKVPELELNVTASSLASHPAKSAMSELGVYLTPASPILVRVRVFVESNQPRKLYPVRETVLARRVSPEVVVLVVAATADPPSEL